MEYQRDPGGDILLFGYIEYHNPISINNSNILTQETKKILLEGILFCEENIKGIFLRDENIKGILTFIKEFKDMTDDIDPEDFFIIEPPEIEDSFDIKLFNKSWWHE